LKGGAGRSKAVDCQAALRLRTRDVFFARSFSNATTDIADIVLAQAVSRRSANPLNGSRASLPSWAFKAGSRAFAEREARKAGLIECTTPGGFLAPHPPHRNDDPYGYAQNHRDGSPTVMLFTSGHNLQCEAGLID
jgi:hypothetical protein